MKYQIKHQYTMGQDSWAAFDEGGRFVEGTFTSKGVDECERRLRDVVSKPEPKGVVREVEI